MLHSALLQIAFSVLAIIAPRARGLTLPQQQQPQANLTRPTDPYAVAVPHTNFVLHLDRPGTPPPRDIPPAEVTETIDNGIELVSLRISMGRGDERADEEAATSMPDPRTYILLLWRHDQEPETPTCTVEDLKNVWVKLRDFVGGSAAPPGIHGKAFVYRLKLENVQVGEGVLITGGGFAATDSIGLPTGSGSNATTVRRSLA